MTSSMLETIAGNAAMASLFSLKQAELRWAKFLKRQNAVKMMTTIAIERKIILRKDEISPCRPLEVN